MIRQDRTERLARQVADDGDFDWTEARRAAGGAGDRAVIEQLAVLAAARDRRRTPSGRPPLAGPPPRLDLAGTLLLALASTRIAVGVVSFALLAGATGGWPGNVALSLALLVASFGITAAGLIAFNWRDPRARELGIVFLVVATSFAIGLHGRPVLGSWTLTAVLGALPADAFLAYAFWRFVLVFPGAPSAAEKHLLRLGTRISGLAGLLLLSATALAVYSTDPRLQDLTSSLARRSAKGTNYWTIIFGALIPALVVLSWRTWRAGVEARRRGWLFLAGLLLGLLPLSCNIVLETISPTYRDWSISLGQLVSRTARGFLLTIPLTTAYAVVFSHVLDVRVIIRRTLQYTFARATLTALTLVPFVFLVRDVYLKRDLPIAAVFSTDRAWIQGLLVLGGFALLLLRGPILTFLDRIFFRNTYDPGEALARILEEARQSRTLAEGAGAAADRMTEIMGLASAAVLVRRADGGLVPASGAVPPLPASSALATLTTVSPSPLYVDLERPGALRRLPDDDLFWLSDTGTRALVPVHGSSGELRAVIALGATRSEEDLAEAHGSLIAALGAGFSAPLERLAQNDSEDRPVSDSHAAQECANCGRVAAAGLDMCHCGGPLATAAVPQMLAGKFVAERVIGHGGMGVVYRALDTTLGRPVAIKTLPRVSMEQVVRLRREARTMATFTHPNLATLFGLETWRGTPMLIVEYLDGGTLADRLHAGVLSWDEWMPIGASILDALTHIHDRGVLHRDLKPSNIGFNGGGAPKLLDFGLAELVDGVTSSAPPVSSTPYAALLSDRRIGTPVYMCPEAARGETPGTHFDLWSFAVVMLEAVSGRLLYPTAEAAIRDLPSATIPDWRASAPPLPPDIEALLDDALAPDPKRRPQSAGEFKQRLGAIAPIGRR